MSADLIVFGEDWGAHPSSTQHLVHNLPGERRVVWVDSIGLRQPRPGMKDLRRAAAKLGAAFGAGRKAPRMDAVPPPGPLVQPILWPMARTAALRRVNRAALAHSVGGAARKSGLRRPVLLVSLPSAVDAVGALGEAGVVYYCGDDFGALAGVDHGAARAFEDELAARADVILAASPAIASRFPASRTVLLEHGVDHDLFATPAPRAADLPNDGPVAGFYGALAPWIDTGLLVDVARRMPAWRFVFVGPVQTDVSALAALPNVHLLGSRPHASLPGYAQHWTAGLIPFHDTPQIRACNPLKLREYLAAGRPVVATPFPALMPYRDHVAVAADAEGFVAALERARAEGICERRRAAVAGESWKARAETLAGIVDRLAA